VAGNSLTGGEHFRHNESDAVTNNLVRLIYSLHEIQRGGNLPASAGEEEPRPPKRKRKKENRPPSLTTVGRGVRLPWLTLDPRRERRLCNPSLLAGTDRGD
jgi:hypothetical protein